MATSKAKSTGPIALPELKRGVFRAYLIGDSPLITHAWSKKAITEMLAKQMGQKLPKYPKSPTRDFLDSIYRMNDGRYGFPATAIKRAMVSSCTSMNKEITKVATQQAFFVNAEAGSAPSAFAGLRTPIQLLRLHSPNAPVIREDMVKLNGRVPDLRYRAEFDPWGMRFDITYNRLVVTDATLAALLDTAGFAVGLGEWRQEKSGVNGQFRLATPAEQKMIDTWSEMPHVEPFLPDEAAFLSEVEAAVRTYGEADENLSDAAQAATVEAVQRSRNGEARQ